MEKRIEEIKSLVLNQHPKFKDSPFSIEALLDAIVAIYDDCKAYPSVEKNGAISRFLQKCTIRINIRVNHLRRFSCDEFKATKVK
jgi:hypothetical protein